MKDRQFDMKNDGQTESPRKKLERNEKLKVCQWHIFLVLTLNTPSQGYEGSPTHQ
jgi:hypothetical protein